MAAEDAAVTVSLRANLKDYEAALKAAVRATERAAKSAEQAVSGIGKKSSFQGVNDNFQKSAGQLASDARILQFQLNDVFSGLASGQGIRALQMQLGQIAQQMSGGSLAQGAKTLGAAFVSMINPINAAVVLFGLAASAAASYFFESEEGAKKADDAARKHLDTLSDIANRYQHIIPEAAAAIEEMKRIRQLGEDANFVKDSIDQLSSQIRQDLIAELGRLGGVVNELELAKALGPEAAAVAIADLRSKFEALIETVSKGLDPTAQLKALMDTIAKLNMEAPTSGFEKLANVITNTVMPALQQLIDQHKTLQTVQDAIAGNVPPAGPLPANAPIPERRVDPYFSDFSQAEKAAQAAAERAQREKTREAEQAAKEAAERLNDAIVNQTKVAVDSVTGLLGKSETANAGEINAFLQRGGVDLDAATTAWCAAFVNSALAQVGIRGSGSNVATSFSTWGKSVGLGQVRRGDVLVESRGRRPGETGGHVGLATGNLRATAEGIQQVEMISGNASDKVQTDWVDASEVIARRATSAFEVPAQALDHISEASQKAAAETKKMADDQLRAAQQLNQQFANILGGGLSGFVQDLMAGKDAGEAFTNMLQRMIGQLADMAIQMFIIKPLMNSLGAGFGGGGGVGLFHGGGTVGMSGRMDGRKFSPMLFAGAPKYASGGFAGLRPGEIPAILHRGEVVVPNARRLAGNAAGSGKIDQSVHQQNRISIDMAGSGFVAANNEDARQVGQNIQKMIQVELVRESRPGGLLRRVS